MSMDSFEEFLKESRDMRTLLVTPGGNHGDSLIHLGHIKKLEEFGFDYQCFNLGERYKWNPFLGFKYLANITLWKTGSRRGFKLVDVPPCTELILFEGGGYMNDIWFGLTLINQVLRRNHRVVAVGPQSYRFSANSAKAFDTNNVVHLFCREKASHERLSEMSLNENIKVSTSPEVALYLTRSDLLKYIEPRQRGYELVAFRNDKESAVKTRTKTKVYANCINPISRDISMRDSLTDFISMVEHADQIYTDRLHVAVLATILDKKVTLYGNMYHKNRGVWEYSLKNKVTFISV